MKIPFSKKLVLRVCKYLVAGILGYLTNLVG